MAVNYKKEFKDVPSALTFLTSDGITGAHILNGKIKAPNSKFDGLDANEKNLLEAADSTGYDIPKTDLSKYMKKADTYEMLDADQKIKELRQKEFEEQYRLGEQWKQVASGPTNRGRQVEKLPNYGDLIPKIPENYREPTPINPKNIPFNPVLRPGIDPVYQNNMPDMTVQNRNRPNNMAMNRGPAGGAGMNNNMLVKLATMQRLGLLG